MELFPWWLNSWHGLNNRFVWRKNTIKSVMHVRRLYFPCWQNIRVLLLRPRRGRTRICNTPEISLISYHICRQWHVRHDGITWSTRCRKNPRIFHMTCEKRHRSHRCWSLTGTTTYHKDRCRTTKASHEGWVHAYTHTPSCRLRVFNNQDGSSRRCGDRQILEFHLINHDYLPIK